MRTISPLSPARSKWAVCTYREDPVVPSPGLRSFRPPRHRHAYPEPVAQVDVLFEGYLGRPDHRVASTVGLVRDGDAIVIVDPGLVPGPHSILDPLAGLGIRPGGRDRRCLLPSSS